jgi:hypothetical protein
MPSLLIDYDSDYDLDSDLIVGRIIYTSDRYTLGTERVDSIGDYLRSLLPDDIDDDDIDDDDIDDDAVVDRLRELGYTVEPVYAYVHGAATISLSPFTCPWDSGQCGFYIVSPDEWRDWGVPDMPTADSVIEDCVSIVDALIRGHVFGYMVEDDDDEVTDSCWGFIGDPAESGMYDALPIEAKNAFEAACNSLGTPIDF